MNNSIKQTPTTPVQKMKTHEFAILHELKKTQFLIDTTFDHDDNMFKLSFKFWASKMNGFATLTLSWKEEKMFEENFLKFKDPAYCEDWYKKLNK